MEELLKLESAGMVECQIRGSGLLVAIGLGMKFVAHNGRDWVVWPMLLALVSRVVVLWMHLRWIGTVV